MSYPIKELHKCIELILKTSLIRSKQLNLIRLKFNHHNSSLKNYRNRMWLEYKYSSGLEVLRHILREWSCCLEITSFQYASLDPYQSARGILHWNFFMWGRALGRPVLWPDLISIIASMRALSEEKKVLSIGKRMDGLGYLDLFIVKWPRPLKVELSRPIFSIR